MSYRKRGWENKEIVWAYEAYARQCFSLFGDLVDHWITFNEPIVPVECGYLGSYHYPCKVDAKAAVVVAYHTQLASSLAVRACHQLHPDHKISIVLNLTPAYPRSQSPEDLQAARIAELFQTRAFWIHPFWDNTRGSWLTFLKNTVYVQKPQRRN